ncbi:MAG: ABC transporter permease [Pyrinomonadaceae bacterium]
MRTLIQNCKYGVRMLLKAPVLTFSAILILGIGIGANTALFTVMNALLIEQLPVEDPDRLVLFEASAPEDFDYGSTSGSTKVENGRLRLTAFTYQSFSRFRENAEGLADVFAFSPLTLNVNADGRSDVVEGQVASGNYHTGLRLRAIVGRTITDDDDTPSAPPVAVISHRYWRQRFGGSPSVIGKQLTINNTAFTVIGVTPANFNGTGEIGSAQDITIPLGWEPKIQSDPKQSQIYGPGTWWLRIMARLGPGATIEQATAKLNTVFQQSVVEHRAARQVEAQAKGDTPIKALEAQYYPQLKLKTGSRGQVDVREEYAPSLSLLLGGLIVVLLIVCISVANLQFSRRADQRREIATRLALGASRWQIVRQMLIESVVLSSIGGGLGIVFAIWIKEVLLRVEDWGGGDLNALNTRLDWRVLGFTALLSIATGVVCGVVPAWNSANTDAKILLNLSSGGARVTSRSWLSKVLIITQIALSLALAIGAGLFFQTLYNLKRTETGFNAHNLLLVDISPESNGYKAEGLAQLYPDLIERFDTIPGVSAATISRIPLLANSRFGRSVYLHDALQATPDANGRIQASGSVYVNYVYENFLDVMQIPLLQGRTLERHDDSASSEVAIVSETFAKRFFPNEIAIGKRFTFSVKKPDSIEIVGIAKDTKYDMQRREIRPMVYLPWRQGMNQMFPATIELRTSNDPYSIVGDVRRAVYDVDKNLPVSNIRTQEEQADKTLHAERLFARILGLFAVFALLLTAIGLYGVLAYSVKRRTNEIGLRMALGADQSAVLKMIIRQGILVTLVGLSLGLIMSYVSEMYLEKTIKLSSMLYGVKVHDLSTYIVVACTMFVVALVACWFPARRATTIDPIKALRHE